MQPIIHVTKEFDSGMEERKGENEKWADGGQKTIKGREMIGGEEVSLDFDNEGGGIGGRETH